MTESRDALIEDLNLAVQRHGTLNVLLTHAIASRVGLSATEFEMLDLLQNQGPLTAGQIASLCGLSTGGVTGLVDRLEKAKLVRRIHDAADRRRVIIEPVHNTQAEQIVGELYQPLSRAFHELVARYTDAELRATLDFITRSSDMAEALRSQLPPLK